MGKTGKNDKTRPDPIPIARPVFDSEEEKGIVETLRSGWVVQGPRVKEFESQFAAFTGSAHAVAASSGTAALHLALVATGIGSGDEVIVPSFTFVASVNAVEYIGARPVLADIRPDTFNIDPDNLREIINQRKSSAGNLRAIIPVSLFGLCADMDAINEIAGQCDLLVIEDAACSLGAYRADRHAGTKVHAAAFSFHPRKSICTGEGGMVITDDPALAERITQLRNHGASASDYQRHLKEGGSLLPDYDLLGYNYRLTDLQGAIGTAQMKKAEMILADRRRAAAIYDDLLAEIDEIIVPTVPDGFTHAYQSYVCLYKFNPLVDSEDIDRGRIEKWNRERNRLMAGMEEAGIGVRQGTHAVHTLGFYREKYGYTDWDYPMSYISDRLSIALPLFYGLTSDEQRRVVGVIKGLLV